MIGEFEPLIHIVRRRKLQWFEHVSRHTDSLANTIMQGSISGNEVDVAQRPAGLTIFTHGLA